MISCVALFVALGGSGYAAITLQRNAVKAKHIAGNAVSSPKVKNRSLRLADFAPGQIPAGERGPQGEPGARGEPGAPGEAGAPGSAAAYGRILAPVGGGYEIDMAASKNVVSVVEGEDEFGTPQPGKACVDVSVPVNTVSVTLLGAGIDGVLLGASPLFCPNTPTEDFVVLTHRSDGVAERRSFMLVVN